MEIISDSSLRVRADEDILMPAIIAEGSGGGSIFDKLIEDYGALAERAEDMVFQHVSGEIEMELRAHFFGCVQIFLGRAVFFFLNISRPMLTCIRFELDCSRASEPSAGSQQHDYEIEIPSTLMGPVSLFASYLAYFQSNLSTRILSDLYRKIAARISETVLQKMIFQGGPGRVSVKEGRAIATECELWLETSRAGLSGGGGGRGIARLVEGPWRRLVEAGRLLALQGSEWDRVKALTFGTTGDEDWEQGVLEVVGFSELRRDEVQTVLRIRADS